MASLLDLGLLAGFSDIFIILFIFTAVYAILMAKNPFGDVKGLNALLAFTVAMMFIFSPTAIAIIKGTIPWYIVMMMALMIILLVVQGFGASIPQSIMGNVGSWVFIIGIFILILNISLQLGQQAGPFLNNNGTVDPDNVQAGGGGDVGTGSFSQNLGATLFHPKVLAMVVVILVSVFAVLWIGYLPA